MEVEFMVFKRKKWTEEKDLGCGLFGEKEPKIHL